MPRTRAELLRALIAYEQPIEPVLAELRAFGWDSQRDLEVVSRGDIVRMLDKYLAGEIAAADLTDWADLIECREDIGFGSKEEAPLSDAIFELANPNLRGVVNQASVRRLIVKLNNVRAA